jgi:uncharacterized protein YndB with AHSA1/START domain
MTRPTTSQAQPAPARCVRRSRVVPASPATVFALLSDPEEHVTLDGSGTIQAVVDAPARLQPGSEFVMRMKGYTTRNRVVEHADDALIAWRHRGRHVWRWELRPVAAGTEVTATFDHSAKRCACVVEALGLPRKAGIALDRTLEKLHGRVT